MAYLKLRDAEIYYEVYGEGRPFLFCSATGVDGQCWKAYQVPEFSRDHKVIIFDYRGTGRSSKTVIKYSTAMFAADAAAILDALGAEQAIVCGHSNGGRVVQTFGAGLPAEGEQAHPGFEWIVVLGDQRHSVKALSGHD